MRVLSAILATIFIAGSADAQNKPRGLREAALGDADLTVHFNGARSDDGMVLISLYDSADLFPKVAVRTAKARIQNGIGKLVFKNLKPGTYALAAAHDANNNGELDKNGFGIPTEGFGFSRQAKVIFGPPKFDAACFPVESRSRTATTIELRYF